jgi:hypothetical protein
MIERIPEGRNGRTAYHIHLQDRPYLTGDTTLVFTSDYILTPVDIPLHMAQTYIEVADKLSRITAIKLVRHGHQIGLRQAKDIVEWLLHNRHLIEPNPALAENR